MNEVAENPPAATGAAGETGATGSAAAVAAIPAAGAIDPATATPGQRLKAARERRGLSLQKAADKMHLDSWVIEALESDQFDKIGPSVYAKGHLKVYAGMLGLPAAEILAAYGAPPTPSAAPRGGMRMRTQEPVGLELPWGSIAAAAVAAVILGVVWLRPWRPRNPSTADPPVTEQPAPGRAAAQSTAQGAADDAQDAPSTAAPDGAPMAAARATTPTPATTPAASAVPAAPGGGGKAQLRLSFSADSWVDIRDAAGNSIFVGNGRANTVKTVTGEAPLRVYLRTASGVQLAINNRVVAIAPRFFAGDVARFEAGADGVLRRNTHSVSSSAAAHDPRPHG